MTPLQPSAGQYLRSDSGGSEAPMLADGSGSGPGPGAPRRRRRCGPLWGSVAVMAILALQIACTTGLFVYFTMAISKLKAQAPGNVEELRCLQVINQQQEGSSLEELISNQSCLKLANTIKAYVATVTENVIRRSVVKGNTRRFGNLSQSCRHAIARWEDSTIHSHLQNITYQDGRLQVNQAGKYYVYSQIYFRYPSDMAGTRGSVPQLVQCINWKTSYSQPILLLKGVGTKCWAPEADYGLHALYQGGLFELKAGDELFVSVSSLAIDYNDAAASYFGAFRLDL
ncbi:tumor necrosis factor ligand superfamily member 11-like isoform X2 [Pezoporus wallicus]|uniref:tumor necrosis factor ligand superfamily member 11-like isoform X2 n=1 Tax=Pezoporus wallicus TaxID=35540 RepID=UPI00254A6E5D|nr:tumor necrosis factor ligand superfamily member 11-like isoform X2 [Pezoporus wallicus]